MTTTDTDEKPPRTVEITAPPTIRRHHPDSAATRVQAGHCLAGGVGGAREIPPLTDPHDELALRRGNRADGGGRHA